MGDAVKIDCAALARMSWLSLDGARPPSSDAGLFVSSHIIMFEAA